MGVRDIISEKSANGVRLIPWDTESKAQNQRLYDQRVACTWDYDAVEKWKGTVRQGTRLMYWIVLGDGTPGKEKMMEDHVKLFPGEKEPLTDTASIMGNALVTPTHQSFVPIGHVGLELLHHLNEEYSLPPSTYWIKSLYISWALQAAGLGRNTMQQVERTAASPPFSCSVIALDTVPGVFQKSEESLRAFYDERGIPRPAVIRTNEEWYLRQSYEVIARKDSSYVWTNPTTGEVIAVPGVILKKDLI